MLCTVVDISTRKALDITRQYAAALEVQRLDSLKLLAGGVAHDFNNLLVSVLGNAQLILSSRQSTGFVKDSLHDIIVSAEQAANLSRQLLAYSGHGRFQLVPIELSRFIREVQPLLQALIRHKERLQLRLHHATNVPLIEGDISQLRQVVLNLVNNAAEAMSESSTGNIHISIGLIRADAAYLSRFTPTDLPPGTYVTLYVSDTGSGIEPHLIERIFEPFVTTKGTGHGLGLAATMGIVRGHKGGIRVYSEPGTGTTFKLIFPRMVSPGADETDSPEHNPTAGCLLVVDDNAIIRRFVKRSLSLLGFRVIEAKDGLEALERFRIESDTIQMVLLDLSMPRMGGAECFSALRRLRPDLRIILTSGFSEEETTARFAGKGLAGFLQKPFTQDTLIEAIENALSK